MNQTFQIPEGVKEVKVDQVDGKIVIEFVPEKVEFKDGDFLSSEESEDVRAILIYKKNNTNEAGYYSMLDLSVEIGGDITNLRPIENCTNHWGYTNTMKLATESEKQLLLDALSKQGYTWNAETKQVEKKRWRAIEWGGYYSISGFGLEDNIFEATDTNSNIDNRRYNNGCYFQTEEQAKSAFDKVKSLLLSLHDVN